MKSNDENARKKGTAASLKKFDIKRDVVVRKLKLKQLDPFLPPKIKEGGQKKTK